MLNNARMTNEELAKKIHKTVATVRNRIKRLENLGYIKSYVTVLQLNKVNKNLVSFTTVSLSSNSEEYLTLFRESIKSYGEVVNCYHISGVVDFILHIVVTDMLEYQKCYTKICNIAKVDRVSSFFVLNMEEGRIDLSNLQKMKSLHP